MGHPAGEEFHLFGPMLEQGLVGGIEAGIPVLYPEGEEDAQHHEQQAYTIQGESNFRFYRTALLDFLGQCSAVFAVEEDVVHDRRAGKFPQWAHLRVKASACADDFSRQLIIQRPCDRLLQEADAVSNNLFQRLFARVAGNLLVVFQRCLHASLQSEHFVKLSRGNFLGVEALRQQQHQMRKVGTQGSEDFDAGRGIARNALGRVVDFPRAKLRIEG